MELVQSRQSSSDDANVIADHSWDIIDVLNDSWKQVQTELDDTHHSESNAAHDFTMRKHSPEDQRSQDNKRLQEKSENTEFATVLATETVDLMEAEKRLGSEKVSQAASKSICSQVTTVHETPAMAVAEELKAWIGCNTCNPRRGISTVPREFITDLRTKPDSKHSKW